LEKVYGDNNQLVAEMLGGYMAGVTVSGCFGLFFKTTQVVLGMAKKSFEAGVMIGEMTYKGSDAHKQL
jgi:K(+)-stimulated pyrophosphate-energized sodium pump